MSGSGIGITSGVGGGVMGSPGPPGSSTGGLGGNSGPGMGGSSGGGGVAVVRTRHPADRAGERGVRLAGSTPRSPAHYNL